MGLIDEYAAQYDPRLLAQVQAAIHATASTVYSESTSVTGHTTRAAFAHQVANGLSTEQMGSLVLDAISFASLTAASTDTTVLNACAALWNEWAGV